MQSLKVQTTEKQSMIDVTRMVASRVRESGVGTGTAVVFCPHTTAGVTIQENSDPDVKADLLDALERAVPTKGKYRHAEGNAAAHIKSSLIGSSVTVFVENRKLVLGRWQAIFFCDFDGPRERTLLVRIEPSGIERSVG